MRLYERCVRAYRSRWERRCEGGLCRSRVRCKRRGGRRDRHGCCIPARMGGTSRVVHHVCRHACDSCLMSLIVAFVRASSVLDIGLCYLLCCLLGECKKLCRSSGWSVATRLIPSVASHRHSRWSGSSKMVSRVYLRAQDGDATS